MNPNDEEDMDETQDDIQAGKDAANDLSGESPNKKGHAADPAEGDGHTVSYAKARRRLIERYGYKEDELDALFKDEPSLVNFYNETIRKGLNKKEAKEIEDQLGWDQDDDFDLSEDDKKRMEDAKTKKRLDEYAARDQSKLKEDARVTPEELDKANRDLADLMKDIDNF